MAVSFKATRIETPPPAKMAPPEFHPTPPLTEPPPHVVPRMSRPGNEPALVRPVWRMVEAEIDEVMPWLFPKLASRWPRLDADKLVYFLKQTMPMRTMLLCRTPNVVGCFFTTQDVFEPVPVAYEKFVRSREGMKKYLDEQANLYQFARKWATSVKAAGFATGNDTDVTMTEMRDIVGKQQYHFYADLQERRVG